MCSADAKREGGFRDGRAIQGSFHQRLQQAGGGKYLEREGRCRNLTRTSQLYPPILPGHLKSNLDAGSIVFIIRYQVPGKIEFVNTPLNCTLQFCFDCTPNSPPAVCTLEVKQAVNLNCFQTSLNPCNLKIQNKSRLDLRDDDKEDGERWAHTS